MSTDPHAWLEDVHGTEAMAWVHARSGEAEADLRSEPLFEELRAGIQDALEAEDRIPLVTQVGEHLYNLWTDAAHPRGLWRRTTWESYRTAHPEWEVLLDVDALGEAEGVPWVWHGARLLRPDHDRALVDLSPGGSDADVTRELDLRTRSFVEDGFVRPEAKGGLAWVDRDTVFAFTDVGEGSRTRSGYPRTVRRWSRGTALADAPEVYAGEVDDLLVHATHDSTPGFERDVVHRALAFYRSRTYLLQDGELVLLDVPESAEVSLHRQWLAVLLRHEWAPPGEHPTGATAYPAGSLLVVELDRFLAGDQDLTPLFVPDGSSSLVDHTWTRSHLVLTVLREVRHEVVVCTPGPDGWSQRPLDTRAPDLATVSVAAVDDEHQDDLWVVTTTWTRPMTLALARLGDDPAAATLEVLKQAPARFDATGLSVTQHWTTSADGTRVPYFQVGPADLPLDGTTPTVLHGYGGFEVPLTPAYDPVVGRAWLARGGVYVVANIRGGGELGPAWHQAALREHRHRAYEDFVAVARDLVARGVTSVARLGCSGRSNGGLLVGNMLTGCPEDFGAVVCQVPLLDMRRYTHLLAGASWMAEYGDPDDPGQWELMRTFSPYHRFDPHRPTPPVYLATSTRDDRVHPGHARKMAALLAAAGRDVTYWEQTEGGHGGASTAEQWALWHALPWVFLHRHLG
jgi:prolyl oligopeptidase